MRIGTQVQIYMAVYIKERYARNEWIDAKVEGIDGDMLTLSCADGQVRTINEKLYLVREKEEI